MTSLKQQLYKAIKGAYPNMFSIDRAEVLARQLEYKISNYERRCRELSSENLIRPIYSDKGSKHIMGYIWVEKRATGQISPNNAQLKATQENLFKVGQFSYKYE